MQGPRLRKILSCGRDPAKPAPAEKTASGRVEETEVIRVADADCSPEEGAVGGDGGGRELGDGGDATEAMTVEGV